MQAFLVAASMIFLAPRAARAQTPDPAAAFFTGALVFVGGFTAGGLLLATSNANSTQDNAGWLAMDAGFIVAPLASHALVGEGLRGLIFAAPPAAMTAGTAVLMDVDSGVIAHGSLPEQRVLWSLFGAGLFSGAVGVVDATFARDRSISLIVAPGVGAGRLGLELWGIL
jgi:hypothetical protein